MTISRMQQPRQMYGLGSLVKSITKGVKGAVKGVVDVAKSPLGLAALGIGGAGLFGMGPLSQLASSSLGTTLAGLKSSPLITGASKFFGGEKTLGKTAAMFGLGGLGAAALQAAGLDTENPNEMPRDVESLKGYLRSGYLKLNPGARPEDVDAFVEANTREYAANGGRIGYADGTSFQRKALEKKGYSDTMQNMTPKEISQLYDSVMGTFSRRFAEGGMIDLGGMEKDYRAEGGFVPIGGKEKADDVPARLSKNEFVFTADAVRNAGGGDVDKGAEVMYNVMKNLESGGKISEKSQGLQGARNMFQTSQRLGEIL